MKTIEAQQAAAFLHEYARGRYAKKRKNEVLLLDQDNSPVAAIRRDGLFCAASRQPDGKLRFSYAPESLERRFMLAAVRYSERGDACKAAVASLWE